jgi:hypothetical protein
MCLINSNAELEVACTQGRAVDQVQAHVGDRVRVTWRAADRPGRTDDGTA